MLISADLRAVQLAGVVDEAEREPVLRALDVVHRGERAAVEPSVVLDLEVGAGEDDRMSVLRPDADRADRDTLERRRANADPADAQGP